MKSKIVLLLSAAILATGCSNHSATNKPVDSTMELSSEYSSSPSAEESISSGEVNVSSFTTGKTLSSEEPLSQTEESSEEVSSSKEKTPEEKL